MGIGEAIGGYMQYKAASESAKVQKNALNFQKERYQHWKDIYGPLQEDLGTYYKNLTGETLSNNEVQKIQMELQQANEQTSNMLAAKGISGSGVEASLLNDNTFKADMLKAQAVATADSRAMAQKTSFLNAGLGLETSIAGSMNNAGANYSNSLLGEGKAESNMWGGFGKAVDGAFGFYKGIGSAQ